MPREFRNRRSSRREAVPRFLDARVEIPAHGRSGGYRVVDLSVQDLCFDVPVDGPVISRGDNFANVVLRAGNYEIRGHLSVLRTWKPLSATTHCGARFYPGSDSDQNELAALVNALTSTNRDRPAS